MTDPTQIPPPPAGSLPGYYPPPANQAVPPQGEPLMAGPSPVPAAPGQTVPPQGYPAGAPPGYYPPPANQAVPPQEGYPTGVPAQSPAVNHAPAGSAPAPAPDPGSQPQTPVPVGGPPDGSASAATGEFADKVACPHCGATTTHWVAEAGVMRCDTCRSTFTLDASGVAHIVNDNVAALVGTELSAGARQDVSAQQVDAEVVTLRCPACGAEVVVQAASNLATVRCHWCRNNLTPNDRIANGARPDGLVPFSVTREQAEEKMSRFLKRRRTFANREFLRSYSLANIQPVYFPYFMVDINAKSDHAGYSAHLQRRYTSGSGNDKTTYYDYDVYQFGRRFSLHINDLLVQSNAEFATLDNRVNTNNIINAVAPWPSGSVVPYSAHYLQGEYRAERRTSNVDDMRGLVMDQAVDISRAQANQTLAFYNHGIAYSQDNVQVLGDRWVTLLCPVWLYSYMQKKKGKPMLHYIAVNGVTGETIGSVPTNRLRMLAVSAVAQVIGMIGGTIWLVLGGF